MRKVVTRVLLVVVAQLLLIELLLQLEVHWLESTGELCTLALFLGILVGCIWASLPAFANVGAPLPRVALRAASALVLFTALYAGDYYYSWHLRPNVGLYREPDWVAQCPSFQHELRERIQSNTWNAEPK